MFSSKDEKPKVKAKPKPKAEAKPKEKAKLSDNELVGRRR